MRIIDYLRALRLAPRHVGNLLQDVSQLRSDAASIETAQRSHHERISMIEQQLRALTVERAGQSNRLQLQEERLSLLEQKMAELFALVTTDQRVDLVDLGDIFLFMYVDDLPYTWVPQACRHADPRSAYGQVPHRAAVDNSAKGEGGATLRILNHYEKVGLESIVLDVGCNYGQGLLRMGRHVHRKGLRTSVIGFDPGRVGSLVPWSIRLNGLGDDVEFHPVGVSCCSGPQIMHSQTAHSEDEHLIDRGECETGLSRIVDCVTLDGWLEQRKFAQHPILKVDTQGGEWDVFDGMHRIWDERLVTAVFEFTPRELMQRDNPVKFLRRISETHEILDLDQLRDEMVAHASEGLPQEFRPLERGQLAAFVENLRNRKPDWTDLLFIPRRLPKCEELIAQLSGATPVELSC